MASNWYRGGYQRRLNCSRHSQSHHGWFDTNLGWVGRPRENAEKEIRSVFLQPRALIAGPAAAMSNWRTIFVFGISWKKETVRKEAGVFQDPPSSKSLFIRTESWITFSFWSPVLFIYLCVVCSRVFCSPTAFLSFYWFFFSKSEFSQWKCSTVLFYWPTIFLGSKSVDLCCILFYQFIFRNKQKIQT